MDSNPLVVFVPALVVAFVLVLFFAVAFLELIWRMDISKMRQVYERRRQKRVPRFRDIRKV